MPARENRRKSRKPRAAKKAGPDPSIRGFIKETSRDAGYRKAAQFLMLLGKDEAARVLRHMAPEEIEGITREIARTHRIEERDASKILEEFGYIKETKTLIALGGIEKAQEMLTASIGAEKAEKVLAKVRKDMAPPPFSFLQDVDVHQAISLMRQESVPVASLILAHLEPKLAARILQALAPEVQREIVPRIARMRRVDSEVIRKAEEALRSKVRENSTAVTEEIDGKAALTEILRFMDPGREQAILQTLEPNVSNEIRKKLYTIDVVFQIPDKDLQRLLRDHSDREIAMLSKGLEEKTKLRILASLSERRRELIRLESEALGAVRKSEVESALQDFLEYVQVLEQKGEITILREREEFV
ncbi:MAG TPA: flagellar motor switch protein FliG [Spirochaetia bacterium]|nr:flagellar motor switch protein FliG [Spirochaetia bacterium]